MNCHYSVQGDYKCTKPKQPTKAAARFTNVYLSDGTHTYNVDEEHFSDDDNIQ
jgi:hypothetical protein